MGLQKFSASHIFDGYRFLSQDNVLLFNEDGSFEAIVDKSEAGDDVQHFDGILTPGLVNCHCHLELSHMKGAIPPHTGLVDFLLSVVKNRGVGEDKILDSIVAAENEMYENGTVAIADICNTDHALTTKRTSKINWHNLVEVINMNDSNLERQLQYYKDIIQKHQAPGGAANMTTSLTPHAPYSVSPATHRALNELTAKAVISIHNQETEAENELFLAGKGEFLKFYEELGVAQPLFTATGKTSLQTYLPFYTNGQTVLLVHNTFITEEDILFAEAHAAKYNLKVVYCLCPNANLYIENRLPPVELLLKHQCRIVLGTDSYSSNWQLSLASEVKTLSDHFPHLPLETLLRWVTSVGAEVLQGNRLYGSFEKGKAPGLVVFEISNKETLGITGRAVRVG